MPITSTAYYVSQMRQGFALPFPGVPQYPPMTREECLAHANDWKVFLQPREQLYQWNFQQNRIQVLPLDQIEVAPEAYRDIVNQIFNGIAPAVVSYPLHRNVQPEIQQNLQQFYYNYIGNLHEGDNATLSSVEAIYERINHLFVNKPDNRLAGFVVGRVQSGKTRNYIGLMLKAASQGWNVIIVLTSNSTQLGIQTYKRIESEFAAAGAGAYARRLNRLPQEEDQLPICGDQDRADALNGNFYWGVAIKEITHLRNIREWLRRNGQYIPDMRILIIDDEADAATPEGIAPDDCWPEEVINQALDNIAQVSADAPDGEKIMREVVAGWFRNLFELDLDERTLATCTNYFGRTPALAQGSLLGDNELRGPLALDEYITDDGEGRSPADALRMFFTGRGRAASDGHNLRSHRTFIKLFRSILEVEQNSTAINKAIRTIIDRDPDDQNVPGYTFDFAKCAYVGYTATFYACLFNRMPDQTPLYPEFVFPLPKSNRYFGLEEIFGTNRANDLPRMNVIHPLDDTDALICDNLGDIQVCRDFDNETIDWEQEGFYINNKLEYCRIYRHAPEGDAENHPEGDAENHPEGDAENPPQGEAANPPQGGFDIDIGEWSSLKKAIAWAFCTAAARRHYHRANAPDGNDEAALISHGSREKCWTSMLVNLNTRQSVHRTLQRIIDAYLKFRCSVAQRDGFMQECEGVWNELTGQFTSQDFSTEFGYAPQDYPQWQEILDDLNYFIGDPDKCRVIQLNCTEAGKTGASQYEDNGDNREANLNRRESEKLWIICGGNGISRGLTLPGLTVSYFNAISKGSGVDRLTQMGRWFGYRDGYELLPRLWMPSESVHEFKNTAFLEQDFHAKLRHSFDAGIAPAEGADFVTLWYWGRKLSPRAYVIKILAQSIETSFVSDDISINQVDVDSIAQNVWDFLTELDNAPGRMDNHNAFYRQYPVWQNIAGAQILAFLGGIKNRYPDSSRRLLEGLCLEIQQTIDDHADPSWDVVLGCQWDETETERCRYHVWQNGWTGTGAPEPHLQEGVAMYSNAMAVTPLYAMIGREVIWRIDAEILSENRQKIVDAVMSDAKEHNGVIDDAVSAALNNADLVNLRDRLGAYADNLLQNPGPMNRTIHGLIPAQGYRNRSHRDYKLKAYQRGHDMRPTLQIYPLRPPVAAHLNQDHPLFAISAYWPGHTPNEFQPVALNDHRIITEAQFRNAVGEILEARGFLMPARALLVSLRERFGAALEDGILRMYAGGNTVYSVCRGGRGGNAYFAHTWAENADVAEARFRQRVVERVIRFLQECTGWRSLQEIFDAIRHEPDFDGLLFATGEHTIRRILTNDVLAQAHIEMEERAHQKRFYRYVAMEE